LAHYANHYFGCCIVSRGRHVHKWSSYASHAAEWGDVVSGALSAPAPVAVVSTLVPREEGPVTKATHYGLYRALAS
jgi:hypothetical protein